jgi:hypothetical protein
MIQQINGASSMNRMHCENDSTTCNQLANNDSVEDSATHSVTTIFPCKKNK